MRLPVLALLACSSLLAQVPAVTSWTPELSLQFQTVTNVSVSPDGKWVAWIQTKPLIETRRSEQIAHLWLSAVDGSRRFPLTRGGRSAITGGVAKWSPDSQYLFYLSNRDSDGSPQIHRIRIAGGEAEKLSDFKGSIGVFGISPDGATLAFTGRETTPEEEKAKKEKRDMRIVGNPADTNQTLYAVPIAADADGKRKQRKIVGAADHIPNFAWSPDSKAIAFTRWPATLYDNWIKADVAEVDVASGTVKDIAASPTAAETDPQYSPDGKFIAITRSIGPKPSWAFANRIALVARAGGAPRELPATYDEQPRVLGWAKDSSKLYFTESKRTRTYIGAMPIDGPPTTVYEASQGVFTADLNATGTHFGLSVETPDQAAEAYAMPVGGGAATRLSAANIDIAKPALGRTEAIRWKSKDGFDVEGLLTYPPRYKQGDKVPLILNIHGGPTGVFNEGFLGKSGIYPLAVFASKGYAILRPNPRGSSGYGKQFRFANYNDWGGKDFEDDQAGVDKVIAMGVADPDRLAIMGWSYGGYMTSWTITQTNRFKAAVIGAAVTNLWSFTGTADIPGFIPDYFGGEPWDNLEPYRKHSPITHIRNVKTPALILHGEADDRVPVGQGYEYYNALKRQGGIAKMVVYPRTPHGPREPKFVLDIMQRHIDWVDKYVR